MKEMMDQTTMMRRREHHCLALNGNQTEMKRSDVSKISVHDDTCKAVVDSRLRPLRMLSSGESVCVHVAVKFVASPAESFRV